MVSSTISFPKQHQKGAITESNFKKCMEAINGKKINGRKVEFKWLANATQKEQKLEKWDQRWSLNFGLGEPKNFYIEVKGRKETFRNSGVYNEDLLFELWSVKCGKTPKPGWLFSEIAQLIAMETEQSFCIFVLKDVQNYICDLLQITGPEDPKIEAERILSPTYSESPHSDLPKFMTNQIYFRLEHGYWKLNPETDRRDAFVNVNVNKIIKSLNHFILPKN